MSRTKSAFIGSISSQLYAILAMGLSMIATPLILKILNKEEYGLVTVLMQIVAYLSMFDFGLGAALTRSLAAHRGDDEESHNAVNRIISTSFFVYGILGLITIIGGCLFAPHVPRVFDMAPNLESAAIQIVYTLSVFVGIQFPLRVFASIFYAHQRQLMFNTMNLGIMIINFCLPVLLLYMGLGLWSYVYTNILSSVIGLIVTFISLRKYYRYIKVRTNYFDKSLLSEMFHFGFFAFLGSIAGQIIFYTDRFFIGSLVSLSAITIFSLTSKASEMARELIFRVMENAYPAMVEISTKEGDKKLKRIHQKLLLVTVCLTTIAFWMVIILNPYFLKLWVGDGFFAGNSILLLALALMVQYTILRVSSICMNGAGQIKGFSIVSMIEAGINLALTLYLGKRFGITGILCATLIAACVTSVWYVPYRTLKFLNIEFKDYFFNQIIKPMLLISILGIIIYWGSVYLFEGVDLNWFNFIGIAFFLFVGLGIWSWMLFLKKEFQVYLPKKLQKYML